VKKIENRSRIADAMDSSRVSLFFRHSVYTLLAIKRVTLFWATV